jgi:processive 1,2-diacylglycerol beta-glucosyltransferase
MLVFRRMNRRTPGQASKLCAHAGASAVRAALTTTMRVLILSAPVGAGHDAAARGVASELRARGHEVDIDDGLALLGRGVHKLIVDGYHCQIEHAPWSWRVLYRGTRSRKLIRLFGAALAVRGGAPLLARIDEGGYDHVVSAYPVVSMVLARLRRTGRLRVPCCALITDFDPHPAWVHPELDDNLGVGRACVTGMRAVRPPVPVLDMDAGVGPDMRRRLGIGAEERMVLIVGGAWGVGNLHGAARAVASLPGVRPVVVTGHNAGLKSRLEQDDRLAGAVVLGFTDLMPGLMAASDVLVANAGGLTCLEAFAAGLPVVMFDPLPGHGEDNSRHMERAGMVTRAPSAEALCALLASTEFWAGTAPATAATATALFERPCTAECLAGMRPAAVPTRAVVRARRVAALTATVMALGMADRVADAVATIPPPDHGEPIVHVWEGR